MIKTDGVCDPAFGGNDDRTYRVTLLRYAYDRRHARIQSVGGEAWQGSSGLSIMKKAI